MKCSSRESGNSLSATWTANRTCFAMCRGALARVADGSYGICLHCEEEIKPKRLDAVPWTKYCIRCQEASDRHEFEADAGETLEELLRHAA